MINLHFTSSIDPAFLAFKRSLKTFIAILLSLIIFWQTPGMAMFAAISSLLFSRSQFGLTIRERQFSMVVTGVSAALLSVPVSLISQSDTGSVIYVVAASFVTFFLIGRRIVPDFPAISVLALSVVEMAFSHTLMSGLRFSGLFLLSTGLVYVMHFVVWPTRPSVRIRAQLGMVRNALMKYHAAVTATYPDLETGIRQTRGLAMEVRQAIAGFRRLWRLFRVDAGNPSMLKSRHLEILLGLEQVFEYLLLVWQFRARAWDSPLFRRLILANRLVHESFDALMQYHHPDWVKPSAHVLEKLNQQVMQMDRDYLNLYQSESGSGSREEWVAVFNATKALLALLRAETGREEIPTAETPGRDLFSVKAGFHTFFGGLLDSLSAFGFGHMAFRLGVRSALIIGATMAYSVFFEPEFGYWLVLFAVLLIRPNLGISIKAGRDRLIGTIAGSLLAFGFLMLIPAGHPLFFAALLLSLFLMIWFTNLDRFVYMVVALTFMIVGLFTMVYPGADSLVWLRIAYTAAIVLLVIFVSFLLWPERARKSFAGALADVLETQSGYFGDIVKRITCEYENDTVINRKPDVEQSLKKLDEVIDAVKNEVMQQRVINHGLEIRNLLYRLLNTLHALDISSRACSFSSHFMEMNSDVQRFAENINRAFQSLITALNDRSRPHAYPEPDKAFLLLRDRFRKIRGQKESPEDEIRQYWNNSTFIWNLKPLIQELEAIRNEINLKMDESP